jgi:UDP-N-acetylmuramate-alanine ligase
VCADKAAIVRGVIAAAMPGDAVVVMSNGDFQNIRSDLAEAWASSS